MNAPMRRTWTREEFFAWADAQEGSYEFDGFEPVDMNGGTINHAAIICNLTVSLTERLRGSGCRALGPNTALATANQAIRYPDMLVTCATLDGNARLVSGAVVIFEVINPSTSHTDRIVKVREYASIDTVRRYVIVESVTVGLTVFERAGAGMPWLADTLSTQDMLHMPELEISVPVGELYRDVDVQP